MLAKIASRDSADDQSMSSNQSSPERRRHPGTDDSEEETADEEVEVLDAINEEVLELFRIYGYFTLRLTRPFCLLLFSIPASRSII